MEIPDTEIGEGDLRVNRYYLDHGEQVLGRHAWTTTQFGPDYTCEPIAGVALDEALPIALGRIAPDVRFPAPADGRIVAPAADGRQIVAGRSSRVLFQKHARIIETLIPVRDAARRVLRAQMENQPFAKGQGDLKRAYQAFVRQFGPIMAKALASGDARLMQKAGLEAELARLERLHAAHYDDQFAVRRALQAGERDIAMANDLLPKIEADIARREPTRGDAFRFEAPRGAMAERERAGAFLLGLARMAEKQGEEGRWVLGRIGGFDIVLAAWVQRFRLDEKCKVEATLAIDLSHGIAGVESDSETKPLGIVSKIEHALLRLDSTHAEVLRSRADAEGRLPAYRARLWSLAHDDRHRRFGPSRDDRPIRHERPNQSDRLRGLYRARSSPGATAGRHCHHGQPLQPQGRTQASQFHA